MKIVFLNSPITEIIKQYTYNVFPYPSPRRLILTHNVRVSCNESVIMFAGIPISVKSSIEAWTRIKIITWHCQKRKEIKKMYRYMYIINRPIKLKIWWIKIWNCKKIKILVVLAWWNLYSLWNFGKSCFMQNDSFNSIIMIMYN